jgi:hypothetical protein
VIDGIDEKKESRVKLSKDLFPNLGQAGTSIVQYIIDKIIDTETDTDNNNKHRNSRTYRWGI